MSNTSIQPNGESRSERDPRLIVASNDIGYLRSLAAGPTILKIEDEFRQLPTPQLKLGGEHSEVTFLFNQYQSLIKRIWHCQKRPVLHEANLLHYASHLSHSAIVATSILMQANRFVTDTRMQVSMGGTARAMSGMLGLLKRDGDNFAPNYTIGPLFEHHLPNDDRTIHGLDWMHRLETVPHCLMAYAMYEFLRAGEFLAERSGEIVSPADQNLHYHYFSSFFQAAGFSTPQNRGAMEQYAVAIDQLTEPSEVVREHIKRFVKITSPWQAIRFPPSPRIDLDHGEVGEFLRPKSKGLFNSYRLIIRN